MKRLILSGVLALFFAAGSSAEVFVADFNNDGMPDILIAEGSMASSFTLLLNEGAGMEGVKFRKTSVMPATGPMMMPTPMMQKETAPKTYDRQEARRPYYMNQQNTPATTPPPAPMPMPAPMGADMTMTPPTLKPISAGTPKLKTSGGQMAPMPMDKKMDQQMMDKNAAPMPAAGGAMKAPGGWGMQEPLAAPAMAAPMPQSGGPGSVAIFNFQDAGTGDNLQWLESGIANILKFDVLEMKNVRLTDRERTSTAFNPDDYMRSGIGAAYVITGMFKRESSERLKIMTKILNGADGKTVLREFEVEGDPADIFSVIEKVGIQLKRELTSL